MNKLYTLIGGALALAAAEGCTHQAIMQAGMVTPIISEQRDIGSVATIGGGYRGSLPNGVEFESTVEYDSTEDVNGPVTLTSSNITVRLSVGKRFGSGSVEHVVSGSIVSRTENPHLSAPGIDEDLDAVNLFGVGVGYRAQFGKGFVGARVEAILNSDNVDALLGIYAGVGF